MTSKFIMVASSKGGVGKSTAALGISGALRDRGCKVLLLDLDLANPCLDMLLGVQDSVLYTIQDVAAGRASVENALIRLCDKQEKKRSKKKKKESERKGELWFLPSAVGKDSPVDGEDIRKIAFEGARELDADFVIMDTGAGINSAVGAASAFADTAVVVTGQMPVALRSAETTVARLSGAGVGDIRLCINSFDAEGVLSQDRKGLFSVIDESRASLLGVVPYDYTLMLSHERLSGGGEESRTAFLNMADRLMGESVPLFSGIKRIRKLKKKLCL